MTIPSRDEAMLANVIARVPELADAAAVTTTVLQGGLSNASYLVDADGARFVARIGCDNASLLGIDRTREQAAFRLADAAGISPRLVAFFRSEGHLVTRFIENAHSPSVERFASPDMIPRLCDVLRDVHALDPVGGAFDPFADIERWVTLLEAREAPRPVRLDPLLERVRGTSRHRTPVAEADLVLCHNDPYHLNFLDDGTRLWLIDWEYSGMGDRMYDLAGVASVLDRPRRDLLLEFYFGTVEPSVRRDLDAMIDVYVCWNTVWCLIQIEDSRIDHDYVELAEQILDRLSVR